MDKSSFFFLSAARLTWQAKVTKKFCGRKQADVGMKPSKTNQTWWEWHHNTFTPSLHLVPFCQLYLVFVVCVHMRVMEGVGWVVLHGLIELHGHVVHVDVHREVWWLQLNCYWAWQMWIILYPEAVQCMSSAESIWHVGVSGMLWTFVAEHRTCRLSYIQKAGEWAVLSALLVCSYAFGVHSLMCM